MVKDNNRTTKKEQHLVSGKSSDSFELARDLESNKKISLIITAVVAAVIIVAIIILVVVPANVFHLRRDVQTAVRTTGNYTHYQVDGSVTGSDKLLTIDLTASVNKANEINLTINRIGMNLAPGQVTIGSNKVTISGDKADPANPVGGFKNASGEIGSIKQFLSPADYLSSGQKGSLIGKIHRSDKLCRWYKISQLGQVQKDAVAKTLSMVVNGKVAAADIGKVDVYIGDQNNLVGEVDIYLNHGLVNRPIILNYHDYKN